MGIANSKTLGLRRWNFVRIPLPSSILKSSYTRDAREDGAQIFTGLNIKINRITYIISLLFGRTPYVSNAHVTVVPQTNEHKAENKHNILKLTLQVRGRVVSWYLRS